MACVKFVYRSMSLFVLLSLILWYCTPDRAMHFELDSYNYDRVARFFCTHGRFSDPIATDQVPIYPMGYPAFIALIYSMGGAHVNAVFVTQILLVLLTFWCIFCIACQLYSHTVACYTVGALAVHVGILVYAQLLLSEVLLMTVLICMFDRLVRWHTTQRFAYAWQAMCLLGVSLIIKSIAILFVPVLFLSVVGRSLLQALLLCLALLLPIIPFSAYNYVHYGTFQVSPQFSVNMLHYFLPKLIAHADHISVQSALERVPCAGTFFQAGCWNRAWHLCWHYISTYPYSASMLWLLNMGKTVFGLFTTQLKIMFNPNVRGGACSFFYADGSIFDRLYRSITYATSSPLIIAMGLVELLILLLRPWCMAIGWYVLAHKNRRMALLIGLFIVLCIAVTGFDGCFRFRMAFEPLAVMLSMSGLLHLRSVVWHQYGTQSTT